MKKIENLRWDDISMDLLVLRHRKTSIVESSREQLLYRRTSKTESRWTLENLFRLRISSDDSNDTRLTSPMASQYLGKRSLHSNRWHYQWNYRHIYRFPLPPSKRTYLKEKEREIEDSWRADAMPPLPGSDVPNATKAIAVIVSVRPTVHPN